MGGSHALSIENAEHQKFKSGLVFFADVSFLIENLWVYDFANCMNNSHTRSFENVEVYERGKWKRWNES